LGNYAAAQQLFTEALAVREKALGPGSVMVAKTLDNLALLDVSLGDYEEAESIFQRALRIRTTQLGADNPATLSTMSQLGQLYVREGDDVRAEPLLVQAIASQQKSAAAGDPDFARGLEVLAQLDDRRRLFDKAGPLHEEALAIRRRVLGENHPETAASLASLARHDHAQGRLAEALPLYQEALKIDINALGPNHPDTLAVERDLALLQIELRHPDEAIDLAHQVRDAQRSILNGVFTFAPEHQRMDFARILQPSDLPAALADADLLAETVLRTKGVVLDSLLEDQAAIRARRDPEVTELLKKRRLLLAQLEQTGTASDFPAVTGERTNRDQLAQEERDVESQLADKGVTSGETRRALSTELADVREALGDQAALVEFIAYDRYVGRLGFQPAYGAVIILHDAPCRWVPLGAAPEIDEQVGLFQKYVRKRVRNVALSEVLHDLHAALCAPVLAQLPEGVRQLILCPDGNLNFISFATLLDADDQFLGTRYDVSYVRSGRDVLQRPPAAPRTRRLVVFADPDYAHAPGTAAPRSRGRVPVRDDSPLPALPGTEREASLVMTEAVHAGLDTLLFRGGDASKLNLDKVDSPYILHLATHGLYLPKSQLAEAPPLPPGEAASMLTLQPMLRSLLALAGAAATLRDWKAGLFPPAANDGLLTAEQATGLDLQQTWLVVLSACDTGSGEARAGEGVLGLRRGFAEAGAQNLLMTLWTADDAATADFMQRFYHDALASGDAPTAFARTQRALLEDARRKAGLSEAVRQIGPFVLSW
jgi:CHAT domain-containing protein